MQISEASTVAVVLPGTGSDAHFASRAFSALDTLTIAVEPDPRRVVAGYLDAMDSAASAHGRIIVGGVSIGAAVALQWAALNPHRTVAVLAALPAWVGSADDAPAAASARYTAAQLRADGLDAVVAAMLTSSPMWLGRELERSWRAQWPHLPQALDEAATYRALDAAVLGAVTAPVGIASAVDDPIHPHRVALEWASALGRAAIRTTTLDTIGSDPSILGATCLAALSALDGDSPSLEPSY
ncbi:pimeloyl-ACP methyl ester carboxylesterase [Rhodococcus sp. 27YEA15]|uniref:alpha/beta hydrolase n=1 Tax=Rhodococcus sp. 27YEA15 TaxID=3156259 RepID=UPI003C7C1A48